MDISVVNSLSYEEFVSVFGSVMEKCPIIAGAVWSLRPFDDVAGLEAAISEFIDGLSESGKEGLLRCYPDLADARVTLSRESREEQASAGIDALSSEEASHMFRLNEQYKQRFGFPFVICARMNDKANIFKQLTTRYKNERATEKARGLEEARKVCHLRLQRLVLSPTSN